MRAIKERLASLYEDLRDGRVDPKLGAVAAQVVNVQVRLLETERKLKETEIFEERIAALEDRFSEADTSLWAS